MYSYYLDPVTGRAYKTLGDIPIRSNFAVDTVPTYIVSNKEAPKDLSEANAVAIELMDFPDSKRAKYFCTANFKIKGIADMLTKSHGVAVKEDVCNTFDNEITIVTVDYKNKDKFRPKEIAEEIFKRIYR